MSANHPVLRYHGGKWRLAPWIISKLPPHRRYIEPFGGAASVLLQKPRARVEIYNDLDEAVVNVFRVLRDPESAAELAHNLRHTPYSRSEYLLSFEPIEDPTEAARRTLIRSYAGYGAMGLRGTRSGFRTNAREDSNRAAYTWSLIPDEIQAFTNRLQGVEIENRDALELIADADRPGTLFYIDPPYLSSVRKGILNEKQVKTEKRGYAHEMSIEDHTLLLEHLTRCNSMVVISGYENDMYKEALPGWRVERQKSKAMNGSETAEVLWFSPNIPASEFELQ